MRYWFDRLMSKGVYAQVPVLFSLSVVFIFIISLIVFYYQLNPSHEGFWAIWWSALMRALDPGTMSGDEGQDSFLLMMLIATVGGIFLVSALIGILTTSLEDMLNELRKGRSIVVEENHTVILGWSSQIFTIIDELAIANENQCHPSVVVLAEKDKVEMEDEIKSRCNNLNRWRRRHMIMMRIACFLEKITWHEIDKKRGFWVCARANTRLVCRTGVPLDPIDLKIVNPNSAKSIIILSPEIDNPDPQIIKTILAIVNNPNRSREPYHIVAAIRDLKNVNVAQLAGGNEVQLLPADDLISRITAQTCRQSGLSIVYTDLMDFGGDEIYFEGQHVPFGETFADALSFYEKSAVFGVHFGRGREQLDPPDYLLLEPNDQLILQHDELTKFYIYGPGVSGLLFAESVNICQDSCVQGASIRVQLKLDEHKIFKSGDQLIVEVEGYRIYLQADCFTGEAYHKLPDIYDQLNFNKVHFQGDHEPQKRVVESHDTFFALTKDHKKVLVSTRNLAGKTVDQILGALNNGQVKGVLCLRDCKQKPSFY